MQSILAGKEIPTFHAEVMELDIVFLKTLRRTVIKPAARAEVMSPNLVVFQLFSGLVIPSSHTLFTDIMVARVLDMRVFGRAGSQDPETSLAPFVVCRLSAMRIQSGSRTKVPAAERAFVIIWPVHS